MIHEGPIFEACGLDKAELEETLPEWRQLAATLTKRLQLGPEDQLDQAERRATQLSSCAVC